MKAIAWIWNKLFAIKTNRWIMKNLDHKYCLWRYDDFKWIMIKKLSQ
jgi:hypothetical protein